MQRLSKFKEKAFLACIKADWLNTVANWLNGMKIIGGEVVHTPDGIIINPFLSSGGGGSMPFSGTAYVAGNKTTGLGTKAWVRCNLSLGTAVDHDGPAPDPFPPNEEWYEVAFTPGDIHESRA